MWWTALALARPGVELGVHVGGTPPQWSARHKEHAYRSKRDGYLLGQAMVALRVNPWFSTEIQAGFVPDFRGLSNRIVIHDYPGTYVPPTAESRLQAQVRGLLLFSPVHGTLLKTTFAFDLGVGTSLVHTVDDLEALGVEPEDDDYELAAATASQWHPALAWAVGPRVALPKKFSLHLRVEGVHWIETIESLNLRRETRVHGLIGVSRFF